MVRHNLRFLLGAFSSIIIVIVPIVAQGADAPAANSQPDRIVVTLAPHPPHPDRPSEIVGPFGTVPGNPKTDPAKPSGLPATLTLPTGLPDLAAGIKDGRGAPIYEPGDGAFKPNLRYVDQFASQNNANLQDLTTPRGGHGHTGVGKQLAGAAKAAALNGGINGAATILEDLLH